ncbi:hypothetical protein RHGRI_010756 [Rhododendron griersonianum]|uniref:Uncharacterized protein n=1 Tax=Rhododendron griersonianum TaxID=479676 RepID=A0AAV6KJV6_9ERIC|nr:hypothetical protein RHGRI_010756 [Rhododendron griersonianum]
MTKVYPNANTTGIAAAASFEKLINPCPSSDGNPVVLTVWKKSLLFNCNGFTVFDAKGNLRLSLSDNWLIYDGETTMNPILSVRKQVNRLNSKSVAHVTSGCASSSGKGSSPVSSPKSPLYDIQGSYPQRCCAVYDGDRRRVAEIKRKEPGVGGVAFGVDVFRLVVQPEMDAAVAMALVILLDQMFGSSKRFSI